MSTFFAVFLGILAAMIVSQLIGWLVFYIWWTEPFKKKPDESTYFDEVAAYREKHNA